MNQQPEQLLKRKALPHLGSLYPGYNFMELTDTRNDSRAIVGTCRTIGDAAVYCELPIALNDEEAALAGRIVADLKRQCERATHYKDGLIVAHHSPEQWRAVKAKEGKGVSESV